MPLPTALMPSSPELASWVTTLHLQWTGGPPCQPCVGAVVPLHCPHDPWASPRCPEFLRHTELPLAGQALSFPELLLQVALAVTSSTRATPPPAFPPHQPGLCPSLPPPSPSGEPTAPLHQHSRDPPFHPRRSHRLHADAAQMSLPATPLFCALDVCGHLPSPLRIQGDVSPDVAAVEGPQLSQ